MHTKYGKRLGLNNVRGGARHLSSTYGTSANFVASAKSNDRTPFMVEAPAEQLVAQMLSFDPSVTEITAQSISVDLIEGVLLYTREQRKAALSRYHDLPEPRIYTPDFVVAVVNEGRRAIEVKLDGYTGDETYQKKLHLAGSILLRHGFDMRVAVVPVNQRMPIWSNVPLVAQSHCRSDLRPTEATRQSIDSALRAGARTAGELMQAVGLEMNLMPSLISLGVVGLDLVNFHIKGSTPVEAAHGDLSHLQLVDRLTA